MVDDSKLFECCNKCNVLMEDFFRSYNQLKILELKFDFMLDKLVDKINYANKVPARWIQVNRVLEENFHTDLEKTAESQNKIRKFRQIVIEAGSRRKLLLQPRVTLKRSMNKTQSSKPSISKPTIDSLKHMETGNVAMETTKNSAIDQRGKCQKYADTLSYFQQPQSSVRKREAAKCSNLDDIENEDDMEFSTEQMSTKSINMVDMTESTMLPDHEDDTPGLEHFNGTNDNTDEKVNSNNHNDNNEYTNTDSLVAFEGNAIFSDPLIEIKLEHQSVVQLQSTDQNIHNIQDPTLNRCPICCKKLASAYGLQVHLEYHKDPMHWVLRCKTCKKKFTSKYYLQAHMKTHQKKIPSKRVITVQENSSKLTLKHLETKYRKEKVVQKNIKTKNVMENEIGNLALNQIFG